VLVTESVRAYFNDCPSLVQGIASFGVGYGAANNNVSLLKPVVGSYIFHLLASSLKTNL
jgi:hypothetical protein